MGNWTSKGVVLSPIDFDGDRVEFTVKRLLVEDMLILTKYIDKENGVLRFTDPLEVCNTARTLVPKYVLDIRGLRCDGMEMTVAQFTEASAEFYFVTLVGRLFAELISISSVGGGHAKNSAAPSLALSAE